MPLAVRTLTGPLSDAERADLAKIYVYTPDFPEAARAVAALEEALAAGQRLHVGEFNGHLIAAVLVDGVDGERVMRYLCVHPATRGRGVAERLVDEARRLEGENGGDYLIAGFNLAQDGIPEMLLSLGFIPHGEGAYRAKL